MGVGKKTTEVARDLGVNVTTLRGWVRDGKIATDGGPGGPGRGIQWTDTAIEQARRLRDRVAGDSSLATAIGPDVSAAIELARKAQALRSPGDVVVATPESARIFRDDSTLSEVLRRTRGKLMVVLGS
jgi:transposase-like protein